ncbi:cAMP-specific 3',5'-cyclic phosphodiesterase 4D [Aphanomyces cochlioides]|nr:cAMP-specific 3',5'-cyclic phosphodiesterase 4D [Aphanomyces cochlioides]
MFKVAPKPTASGRGTSDQKIQGSNNGTGQQLVGVAPDPAAAAAPNLPTTSGRHGTAHNLRRHTILKQTMTVTSNEKMDNRRSSMGLATTLLYPQSVADRHESTKITKLLEETYGFNYMTNEFTANSLVEREYQTYYTEINLASACNFSLFLWIIWLASTFLDLYFFVNSDDGQLTVTESARRSILFSLPFILPTPFLIAMCRHKQYEQHMQLIFSVIVHCFALSLMGGGFFCSSNQVQTFTSHTMDNIMAYATSTNNAATAAIGFLANSATSGGASTFAATINQSTVNFGLMTKSPSGGGGSILVQNLTLSNGVVLNNLVLNATQVFTLNNNSVTAWWEYPDRNGTLADILHFFILDVVLPFSQLNTNLVRPIVVLIIAPMFHLNAAHYIVVAFNVNLFYCLVLSLTYPITSSSFLTRCKFYLVFVLVTLTVIMVFRARQTDRFMRLNFLNVRNVEEKVRITQEQKEKIQNENRSLKRMLQAHEANTSDTLDLDSPMAKVITDLTKIQQNSALDRSLKANLNEIVTLLTKQGHNLFAPDIHEQLTSKTGEVEIDADTKGWATTVLASKSYQRNNNRRSSTQSDDADHVIASINLHPDVRPPDEDVLSKVNAMMMLYGWNVDIHEISELSQGKPISYVTYVIFERHNLFTSCAVERNVMLNFFWFIDAGYFPNPYHNNCHAADVVNYVEFMLSAVDGGFFMTLLNMQEVFASIVAAAIHDFRHPGKSNNFLVKSGHTFAVQYSDSSVLERMHLAESFFLASEPQFNIFSGMKAQQYTEVRKAIIEMVLTTDLSVHLQLVGSLKTALLSQNKNDVMESPMMLMKIVIKCADIGHSSKSTLLHARWSELIIEEFFLQGDEEKELCMEISPFMNRSSENSAKNQVGFFEFIILPFFDVVAEIVFTPGFKPILDQVHSNYNLWKKAEMLQLKNIKDILDQVFCVDEHHTGTASVNRISFAARPTVSAGHSYWRQSGANVTHSHMLPPPAMMEEPNDDSSAAS